jgi:hypothetical protein
MPLTLWERDFLVNAASGRKPLTPRQVQALDRFGLAFAEWETRNA